MKTVNNRNGIALFSTLLAIVGTGVLLLLTFLIGQQNAQNIGLYFLYQGATLVVALIVIVLIRVVKRNELVYLSIGNLSAQTAPIPLLGVKKTDNWLATGIKFAVIISGVTGAYLYFGYQEALAEVQIYQWLLALLIALPLAFTNSFTEGIITRWTIAEGLTGSLAKYAPWVSALIFGTAHYFGVPGGFVGTIMAGFLAWLLTRSIQDTKGIGWAWIVHFIQDILIFTVTIGIFI